MKKPAHKPIGISTNTSFRRKKDRVQDLQFLRVVDATGDATPKRVMIHRNLFSPGFANYSTIWKDFLTQNGSVFKFHINKPFLFDVTLDNGTQFRSFTGVATKTYTVGVDDISIGVGSPNQFEIINDSGDNITVNVYSDGGQLSTATIADNGTEEFRYRPTIWLQGTYDMNAVGDPDDANTEISLLGIKSADIVVTYSGSFSFTLTNIVFA